MGNADNWYKLVTMLTLLHFAWVGTPGAIYAAYAARRQRRFTQSCPDLLQAMREESDSALLNRMLLLACIVSPFAVIVNELNWFFRTRSQAQERTHL